MTPDPIDLTQKLIRCASVTPEDDGAIPLLADILAGAGFRVERVDRGGICNLFARWDAPEPGPVLGFNGHTDVVPVGDRDAWRHDPFGAEIHGDVLFGRGATDMKSGVASFVAAACRIIAAQPAKGAIVITITGDEEGSATDGTAAILDWMAAAGEGMDACLVGEPTCPETMGEMIKVGRRGSMTAYLEARGHQGHSAYPHRAKNPLPVLVRCLDRLAAHSLDDGTAHFDPSTLAITTIDTGNPANNVIPAEARATVNIRFNDAHNSTGLKDWIGAEMAAASDGTGVALSARFQVSGESFLTPPGAFSDMVAAAVHGETGVKPVLSTSGGASDARFIRAICPVVEFGLVGKTMHQVDECVPVGQITQLTEIYARIIHDFLQQ